MKRAALLMLPALLTACSSGPAPTRPPVLLPPAYTGTPAEASAVLAADWWKAYREPALDGLVDQALAANLDLKLAAARIDEAAVAVTLARSAQWPTVNLDAAVTRSRSSVLNGQPITQAEATTHRVALSTSFEIDLWGRLRNATSAAQEQLLSTQYARDTVRLALVGTLVQTWFAVRALDLQQAAIAQQLQLRADSLALVQRRVRGGVASGLDQAQAEAALAALAAQAHELARQRELLVHQLGTLAGQPGLQLPVDARTLPPLSTVPPGLPSELLQRRPDVQQAEAAMRASFANFDYVKKSAWPVLGLTGSLGQQSADLADLLRTGARIWSIGPSLLVSVFDAGRNQARSAEARAQAEQAAVGWQQSAQTAFREVADALSNQRLLAAQEAELNRQRAAAKEAQRLSVKRYDAGYSAYLEVLDAQRSELDAELALLRVRQQRLDAQVALQKALGGGWQAGASR
jgi:multidrug efflux system outer membrane protein